MSKTFDHSDLPFVVELDDRTGQIINRPRQPGQMPTPGTPQDLLLAKVFMKLDQLLERIAKIESSGIPPAPEAQTAPAPEPPKYDDLINLNTATVEQLTDLPHVSEKTAKRLITEREKGDFKSLEDAIARINNAYITGQRYDELVEMVTV
jgi:hypothetical protein